MAQLHERLAQARRMLVDAGVDPDEAAIDAEVLARHVLGWDRASLLIHFREPAPPGLDPFFPQLLARRIAREPVAYIVGQREFWGRAFEVTPAVLVPRPETEIIVEEVLDEARSGAGAGSIVDVGTGSGCLAVTLALECPDSRVWATDLSLDALAVAKRNARRHGVEERVAFVRCDVLEGIDVRADMIVSNPPYIPAGDANRAPAGGRAVRAAGSALRRRGRPRRDSPPAGGLSRQACA